MVWRWILSFAVLAGPAVAQAHAQAPAVIDHVDEATLARIAADLRFNRIPPIEEPQIRCQKPGEAPRRCKPGEVPPDLKRDGKTKGYIPSWAVSGSAFSTPGGLTISARALDCRADDKAVTCAAIQFEAAVPIPGDLKVADFIEVFNNTHPSVRVVANGGALLCQRYVLLRGGVTPENLRLTLKDFAEVAELLQE